MANSRQKGATFERDVCRALSLELGCQFKRNLDQYQERDLGDVTCDDPAFPFLIECKAYASGTDCRAIWWRQACTAAAKANKIPAVVYKFNHHPIRVRVGIDTITRAHGQTAVTDKDADITLAGLAYLAREIIARETA